MREFAGAEFCEMDAVIGAQHSNLSGFIGAALDEIVALVNEAVPGIDENQTSLLDPCFHQVIEIPQIAVRLRVAHRFAWRQVG